MINEKFNFKKMADKYEEKNYEQNIKKNLANSISQKIILRFRNVSLKTYWSQHSKSTQDTERWKEKQSAQNPRLRHLISEEQ